MKTITFRKKWVIAISKLPKELRNDAIIALYNFFETEETHHPETLIANLLWDVKQDLKKSAERSEKARLKRQQKKAEKQEPKQPDTTTPPNIIDDTSIREYEAHPELYMFDGFMSYLISRGRGELLPAVPDGMNEVTLLCFFRNWVIENNKLGELTKLNSFCGLFRHALPTLVKKNVDMVPYNHISQS